jgi:hypothetical protein
MIIFTGFAVRLLTYNTPWNCFIRFTVQFTWATKFLRFDDSATKMATSTNVDKAVDDLLTCTICLEKFKVPKYLPCLHTLSFISFIGIIECCDKSLNDLW